MLIFCNFNLLIVKLASQHSTRTLDILSQ